MDADVISLIQQARDPNVAFHKFLLDYKKEDPRLFCFFEGMDDNAYYSPRIYVDYLHYVCNGKRNVVHVHNRITNSPEYASTKTAYFVDNDFDKSLDITSIFETQCYSVENMYSEGRCFRQILEERFQIARNSPDYHTSCSIYDNLQKEFHEKTKLINAWIACQVNAAGVKLSLNDNKSLKEIFKDLVNDELLLKPLTEIDSIMKLNVFFPQAEHINLQEVETMIDKLSNKEFRYSFRGKFEFAFFMSFLQKFQKNIRSSVKTVLSKSYPAQPTFSENPNGLMQTLSGSAKNFQNLIPYINSRL